MPARIAVDPAIGPLPTRTFRLVTPVEACSGSDSTVPRTAAPTELAQPGSTACQNAPHRAAYGHHRQFSSEALAGFAPGTRSLNLTRAVARNDRYLGHPVRAGLDLHHPFAQGQQRQHHWCYLEALVHECGVKQQLPDVYRLHALVI